MQHAVKPPKPNAPSLGSQLSYGKWYYGVDTEAQPTIRRFTDGIEKIYPCKDGGEVVVTYISRGDKSSSLNIVKTGNPQDAGKGDWFRSFYSDIAVKHYQDRFGNNVTKTVKKKGAKKQILSTQNGRATEDVHVPLKRWEIINDGYEGKKVDSQINSWVPKDFDRFNY